jgi:murein DD-endopeptidase MepM/ murein hydrolase activator NlpD
MVFATLYVMVSLWYYPVFLRVIKKSIQKDEIIFDAENGMGMAYVETSVQLSAEDPASEQENLLTGLPEPSEFSKPRMLLFSSYQIERGDTIGELAVNFGLNQDTLLSLNNIKNSRLLQIGQTLKVPNQDGILYTVKRGDTLSSIAEKYRIPAEAIQTVNELFSPSVKTGSSLFVPGARLPQTDLQEINGDLFIWPTRGYVTSPYGYRANPFTGARQFHSGLDIGAPIGTPVRAAMAGRVIAAAVNESNGNYVVITHHSGYRTLYAHLNVIRVKSGAYVKTGEHIGDVGTTGISTGPHLHFTVYKNGVTMNPRLLIN